MQDNTSSHSAMLTTSHIVRKGFKVIKSIELLLDFSNTNPIENLWCIIKKDVSENGKQFKQKILGSNILCKIIIHVYKNCVNQCGLQLWPLFIKKIVCSFIYKEEFIALCMIKLNTSKQFIINV